MCSCRDSVLMLHWHMDCCVDWSFINVQRDACVAHNTMTRFQGRAAMALQWTVRKVVALFEANTGFSLLASAWHEKKYHWTENGNSQITRAIPNLLLRSAEPVGDEDSLCLGSYIDQVVAVGRFLKRTHLRQHCTCCSSQAQGTHTT